MEQEPTPIIELLVLILFLGSITFLLGAIFQGFVGSDLQCCCQSAYAYRIFYFSYSTISRHCVKKEPLKAWLSAPGQLLKLDLVLLLITGWANNLCNGILDYPYKYRF